MEKRRDDPPDSLLHSPYLRQGMFEWDPATNTGNLSKDLLSYLGLPQNYPVNIDAWSKVTPHG